MTGRRICYLLTVAIGFVFFCFYQQWFSWLLLVGILWLPLVSLLLSLPAICTARVRIRAPEQTRAGMPARASLQIEGLFPQMPIRCKVGLENRLTGERCGQARGADPYGPLRADGFAVQEALVLRLSGALAFFQNRPDTGKGLYSAPTLTGAAASGTGANAGAGLEAQARGRKRGVL